LSGKNALEALNLLERKCSGEDVKRTVRCQIGNFPSDADDVSAPNLF